MNYVEPIYDWYGQEAVEEVYPKPEVPKPAPVPTAKEEQDRMWRLVEQYSKN
jgi:hypothetical protein